MRIYTKTGDGGYTKLGDGAMVAKGDQRVWAYGTIDELSSFLGLALSFLPAHETQLQADLVWLQRKLFQSGAILAKAPGELFPEDLLYLENAIDRLEEVLPPLREFILPGGSKGAALLHVARAVCRRAERLVSILDSEEYSEKPLILAFLNRLSDYLFCAAQLLNSEEGHRESLAKEQDPSSTRS